MTQVADLCMEERQLAGISRLDLDDSLPSDQCSEAEMQQNNVAFDESGQSDAH